MAQPSVSVIIVNYNSGALLAKAVESVLASITIPIEIFVSDNGSKDNSVALLKQTQKSNRNLHIIENGANLGFAQGNNVVLPRATGDYILFLNPDCIIEPDTIIRMIEVMEANPDAGMAGCLIKNLDGSEQPGCRRFIPTPWRSLMRVLNFPNLFPSHPKLQDFNLLGTPLPSGPVDIEAISGAFMIVRRVAIEKVGPLDPGYFLHCEDLDWCMRFRQANYRVMFVPDVVITHIKGGCSVNRPVFVEWHKHKGMLRFYRKFFQQQYSGSLMWGVFVAVWVRFLLKIVFFSLRRDGNEETISPLLSSSASRIAANSPSVLVTGASSQIGQFLLPRLVDQGYEVHALSRSFRRSTADNVIWHKADIEKHELPPIDIDNVIHLAPLPLFPSLLPLLSGKVRRVIAFGSTSRFSKQSSNDPYERSFAVSLGRAEDAIASYCEARNIAWTIFRPTLIYGCGMDKNISVITRFIRRFGFFPLLGDAQGLRQPVHADDLAAACTIALANPLANNRAYDLSGGETLVYRAMVERIFTRLGMRPKFFNVPLRLFINLMRAASFLPGYGYLSSEMAIRMNQDLCFDHHQASMDFGYTPRKFEPPLNA